MKLEVENLNISFGKTRVVEGVSFTIHPQETLGIIGQSGAGKSSLALSLLKLNPQAKIEGKILLDGDDLLQKSDKEMRSIRGKKIGIMFQDPLSALNPTMKIGDQLIEAMILHEGKIGAQKRALSLLEEMEIDHPIERYHQYPHELSGGMRQRVLLGIALSANPSLLIADELSTALDKKTQKSIFSLLKKKALTTSLLLISHDLSLIAEMTHRILVMHQGKIIEEGLTSTLLQHPKHPYTQKLIEDTKQWNAL